MNTTYIPAPGSLAERVCHHFLANPAAVLSARALILQFELSASVATLEDLLEDCVHARLLKQDRGDAYMAGDRLLAAAAAPLAPSPHPSQKRLPELDPTKLQVRKGVPLPEINNGSQRRPKYHDILDLLIEPGSMLEIPSAYADPVRKSFSKYCKIHLGRKFAVRACKNGKSGIWRVA